MRRLAGGVLYILMFQKKYSRVMIRAQRNEDVKHSALKLYIHSHVKQNIKERVYISFAEAAMSCPLSEEIKRKGNKMKRRSIFFYKKYWREINIKNININIFFFTFFL